MDEIAATARRDDAASIRALLDQDFAFVGESADEEVLHFERWIGPVLTAKPFYFSFIPDFAVASRPLEMGDSRQVDYVVEGKMVGRRHYEGGVLVNEGAYRGTLRFGRHYTWSSTGAMISMEPHDDAGMPHGTAYQWAEDGRLIGSYTMAHGTGYDLWWSSTDNEPAKLFQLYSFRDGELCNAEWWLSEDHVLFAERPWHLRQLHGVEREWNHTGGLKRGFPRYWINGERVTKPQYLRTAAKDATLPPFRLEDNLPQREFPPEVEERVKLHG